VAAVETVLGAARAAGRPSLVGYVTGGIRAGWTDLLAAMIGAGADAIEIGLPFSDPMLDGPVIQRASEAALARGASPDRILAELRAAGPWPVPLIAMSYANLAFRPGLPGYCAGLAAAGFSGTIIPDLPVAEADGYLTAAGQAGLDATLMVTPATPAVQRRVIAARTRGFLYVMSVMATTGTTAERQDPSRWAVAAQTLAAQPPAAGAAGGPGRPVLIGFGIDTPARAAAAARHADGVIVASALMRRVLDGATAAEVGRAVGELRAAVDGARR
jgi:tryptophan synthase alpha chain